MVENYSVERRQRTKLQHPIRGRIIIVDDRVASGQRDDKAGSAAREALSSWGITCPQPTVVPEEPAAIRASIRAALDEGARFILTAGGTGIRSSDTVPEVTREFLETELPGLETHILMRGLRSTPIAGLSRGLVGITGRGGRDALIVNAPGSRGGVMDAVSIMGEAIPHVFSQLGEGDECPRS